MNDTTIAWYKSAVIQRLALGIVMHVIGMTPLSKYLVGVDLAPAIDYLLEALGTAMDGWALHARATKPTPPVAISQKKADAANTPVDPSNLPPEILQ